MSMITDILEIMTGKVHFYLSVGRKPAIEIFLHDERKEIVAEIKNPVLAFELGLHELAKGKGSGGYVLEKIKDAGYKVKVKYKMFELEL
jgi:hypothetical protein